MLNIQVINGINSKGYVVRAHHENAKTHDNFGPMDYVVVETSGLRITFFTTAPYGVNYFQIKSITDQYKDRTYTAQRYHYKHIPTVSMLNFEIYKGSNEYKRNLRRTKREDAMHYARCELFNAGISVSRNDNSELYVGDVFMNFSLSGTIRIFVNNTQLFDEHTNINDAIAQFSELIKLEVTA